MRVLGLTVGRNEANRYLPVVLNHMKRYLDAHFFFDDCSTDETPTIAEDLDCVVYQRPDDVPTFLTHEGAFRQAAWDTFKWAMEPGPGDWVFVVDCDEVFVGELPPPEGVAWRFWVPEVFGYRGVDQPRIRQDGLWGNIIAIRYFRFEDRPFGQIQEMGTASVPEYVRSSIWPLWKQGWLMHYGYADQRDQLAKYSRYSRRAGHNMNHINSILGPEMRLAEWPYEWVKEMRRAR